MLTTATIYEIVVLAGISYAFLKGLSIGLKDFVKKYPDSDASRYLTGNDQSQNKEEQEEK